MQAALGSGPRYESITPLLKKLARLGQTTDPIQPDEIAEALYLLLDDKLTDTQSAALLSLLHQKKKDQDTAIIGESLRCIIQPKIDEATLQQVISTRRKPEGNYLGGLVSQSFNYQNNTPLSLYLVRTRRYRWQCHFNSCLCGSHCIVHCVSIPPSLPARLHGRKLTHS
jgi:hypothetical protein